MYKLSGSHAKLRRAHKHLETLKGEIKDFINTDPYAFPVQPHPAAPSYLMRVRIHHVPPEDWGTLVGDIAHNARSALDLLISDISKLRKNDRERFGLQFPIFDHRRTRHYGRRRVTGYVDKEKRYLAGVETPHRTIIEGFQPYKRRDFSNDILGLLANINDADKHRLLHLIGAVARVTLSPRPLSPGQPINLGPLKIGAGTTIQFGGAIQIGRDIEIEVLDGGMIVRDDAPIARLVLPSRYQVRIQPNVSLAIRFDKGTSRVEGRDVIGTLAAIIYRVEEVLRKF